MALGRRNERSQVPLVSGLVAIQMAVLTAYSMPAFVNGQNWDHVYADSDDGLRWCCFGRDTGGSSLDQGNGDSSFADCLSKPIFHASPTTTVIPGVSRYADVAYLLDGVCHQAANRILYPAGVLVDKARGYGLSSFLFNTFGLRTTVPWPRLTHCASLLSGTSVGSSSGGTPMNTRGQR